MTNTTTTENFVVPELKGRFEIKIYADSHKYGDAINEFVEKLKEMTIENTKDPVSPYYVNVTDAWVEDADEVA